MMFDSDGNGPGYIWKEVNVHTKCKDTDFQNILIS